MSTLWQNFFQRGTGEKVATLSPECQNIPLTVTITVVPDVSEACMLQILFGQYSI